MKNDKDLKKIVGESFVDMSIKDMTKVEGTGGAHADSIASTAVTAISAVSDAGVISFTVKATKVKKCF